MSKRLCPSCKEKGIRTPGVKDECPHSHEVKGEKQKCWCCETCRKECRDDI